MFESVGSPWGADLRGALPTCLPYKSLRGHLDGLQAFNDYLQDFGYHSCFPELTSVIM